MAELANLSPLGQLRAGKLGRRLTNLVIGQILFGASMAMMIRAGLGTMPWDVLPGGLPLPAAIALMLGGVLGLGTVVYALAIGPLTQLFLPRLTIELESNPRRPKATSPVTRATIRGMTTPSSAPFEFAGTWPARLIATAIHAGQGLRPDLAELIALPEADRLREEDPFTDRLIDGFDTRVYVDRSRFEVDLNRDADGAVYRSPAEAWDLKVWHDTELDAANVAASRETHTAFYDELRARLDECAKRGPFVIYDVHSYNHRRDGADRPAAPEAENPEVNVGTGSLNSERFGGVVTAFIGALQAQRVPRGTLDVRENVRFFGGNLAQWVHENYPETGIVLALEFKKTFMDEWSGIPDEEHLGALNAALRETVPATLAALDKLEAP